MEICEKMNNCI